MTKRVTIKDVAKHAGTSYQTVSRVINNRPDVAPKTRKRILKVIDDLNYRPSMAATTRANPKTYIMAVAISPDNENLLYEGDPHLLRIIRGIDHALEVRNYSLLLSTIKFESNGKIKSRLLSRQLADGVIIRSSVYDPSDVAKLFTEKGYHVVVVGYSKGHNIPSIRSDDEHGGYTQAQHLLALGHTEIGIITGPEIDPATTMRRQGHERAMANSGFAIDSMLAVEGDYTFDSGYTAAGKLMESMPNLTAIAAFSDTMAIGAMKWLKNQGYNIPNDISVIGYDDTPDAPRQTPALTTIRLPSIDEGQRAVQILFDLIENRKLHSTDVVLPVHLVVRDSTSRSRPTLQSKQQGPME